MVIWINFHLSFVGFAYYLFSQSTIYCDVTNKWLPAFRFHFWQIVFGIDSTRFGIIAISYSFSVCMDNHFSLFNDLGLDHKTSFLTNCVCYSHLIALGNEERFVVTRSLFWIILSVNQGGERIRNIRFLYAKFASNCGNHRLFFVSEYTKE